MTFCAPSAPFPRRPAQSAAPRPERQRSSLAAAADLHLPAAQQGHGRPRVGRAGLCADARLVGARARQHRAHRALPGGGAARLPRGHPLGGTARLLAAGRSVDGPSTRGQHSTSASASPALSPAERAAARVTRVGRELLLRHQRKFAARKHTPSIIIIIIQTAFRHLPGRAAIDEDEGRAASDSVRDS